LVIAAVDWGLDRLSGDYPTWPWIVVIAPFATFVLIVPIWQVVGIWRSARHFRGRQLHDGRHVGRWLWAVVACVLSFCWFLKTVAVAVDALNSRRPEARRGRAGGSVRGKGWKGT